MFEYLCESDDDLRAMCKIKLILKDISIQIKANL